MTPDIMKEAEAVKICEEWFAYIARQEEKTRKMQQLAAHARKGPSQAKEAQRELRQLDRQPKVYDGARLQPAVKCLVEFYRANNEKGQTDD